MAGNKYKYRSETEQYRIGEKSARAGLPEGALIKSPECVSYTKSRRSLEEAISCGITLEGMCVMCDCSTMELLVELPGGMQGVIPRSEACYSPTGEPIKDISIITRVGKPVQFKVKGIKENIDGKSVAVLSRRAAQKECFEEYISSLKTGDIIPARITHLEPFGAFCDIGCGIVSLLTVDKISVSRISHPSDRFKTGDYIDVIIQSIEENGRIYLTHRELLGTWEENVADFLPGQTVTGIIRSVEEYGVFVELSPNLAGLAELYPGAEPGDACSVYIKSIIPERMKIKLVMIDTCGPAEVIPCKYYIDSSRTKHISSWKYSPEGCRKLVETLFDQKTDSVCIP